MIDLEKRILRRRADQDEPSVLDVGQQDVLLTLVEAVDFVDEDDRALLAVFAVLLGLLDDGADVGDARRDGVEFLERAVREARDHLSERRLACAGRPIENHGRQIVRILQQALDDTERGLGAQNLTAEDGVLASIAQFAGGDARMALNLLEEMAAMLPPTGGALTQFFPLTSASAASMPR